MFNDRLSREEANERIKERMHEADTYSSQKRLGYADYGVARWMLVLILVIAVIAVGLLH